MVSDDLVVLPVRHHSPSCAWHVGEQIRLRRPSVVLVEGPRSFDALVPLQAALLTAALDEGSGEATGERRAAQPVTEYPPAERGAPVSLDGRDLEGGGVNTGAMRGELLVLNVWGSWCAPCRTEAPVLRSVIADDDKVWFEIRVPKRPNGSKGWVPRSALRLRTVTTLFELDKSRQKAKLFKDGKRIWQSSVGIGAPGTPTPAGDYWVRERLSNLGGNAAYGPWAFGTAAYSRLSDWPGGGVVGIHGTNAPGLLPGRVSHGCIRVANEAILRLRDLVPVGTPIRIRA